MQKDHQGNWIDIFSGITILNIHDPILEVSEVL